MSTRLGRSRPHRTRTRARIIRWTTLCVVTAGLAVATGTAESSAAEFTGRTTLKLADGTSVGIVKFTVFKDKTLVWVGVQASPTRSSWVGFHGFHIHANDDPSNGSGCVADPAASPTTWFTAVDGHYAKAGTSHADHLGDMPSVLVGSDGSGWLTFTTERLSISDLKGRAVVLHAKPDNFGNVPTGTAAEAYQPNSEAATTKTAKTGNAGDRLACGVITIDGSRSEAFARSAEES